jgi:hypothetical protein
MVVVIDLDRATLRYRYRNVPSYCDTLRNSYIHSEFLYPALSYTPARAQDFALGPFVISLAKAQFPLSLSLSLVSSTQPASIPCPVATYMYVHKVPYLSIATTS